MKNIITVDSGPDAGFELRATVIIHDSGDVTLVVTGGRDHVGAVALAVPRPSLEDPERASATTSVLTMLGHKEDVLVKEVGELVAAASGRSVAVVGGVHYDGLTPEQLQVLRRLWRSLAERVVRQIRESG